jgi:nitric oxide reductase NorQ protein
VEIMAELELPNEVKLKIATASGRTEAALYLVEHLGGVVEARKVGAEKIAQTIATLRDIKYESAMGGVSKILQGGPITKSESESELGGLTIVHERAIGPLEVRAESLVVEQKVESVHQADTAPNGSGRNLSLTELIPHNVPKYFKKRLVGKVKDFDFLLELFKVCRCEKPSMHSPDGPDGTAHGVKLCKKCNLPAYRRAVLIKGEQGCGKNHIVAKVGERLTLPLFRIEFDGTTESSDLLGDVHQSHDGKWVWVDGPLTLAVKYGGIFVGDEVNMMRSDMVSKLHALLEPDGYLYLTYTNEVIRQHPNFWFIGTCNPHYEGTKPLNKALASRFIHMPMGYRAKTDIRLTGDKKLVELAERMRTMYLDEQITQPVSSRDLIQFTELRQRFGAKLAIEIFSSKFEPEEAREIKDVMEILIPREEVAEEAEEAEDEEA